MGFYVTKKRVKDFIKQHKLNQQSLVELNLCLGDLKEFPKENKNQIRFYEKVKKHLQVSN
jgi:hypothetical protein